MRSLLLAAAAATAFIAAPAMAQDTAPDGTRAFGVEPYVGLMGAWEQFDNEPNGNGIPIINRANGTRDTNYRLDGAEVEGVIGVNVPLGMFFVGGEGNVAKSVSGDIDWEYGVSGRAGIRAGDTGMFYGKVGYEWVNFDKFGDNSPDYNAMTYGIGAEVGTKDIGLGNIRHGGVRVRAEVSTFGDFHSFRPSMGLITHF